MGNPLEISEVRIRLMDGSPSGLVAMASCVVGGALVLNNIAIRRSGDGRLRLSYPARFSRTGAKHYFFNPISRAAQAALDEAILARLPGGQA